MKVKHEENRCPLCGKPNDCAIVAGDDPATCWCMTTKIPQELRILAQKERERNGIKVKACICRNCVEEYLEKKPNNEPVGTQQE